MSNIYVGDVGTVIMSTIYDQNDMIVDLSDATSLIFKFESPSHLKTSHDAVFNTDGKDGKIYYITQSGDINERGTWTYQATISFSNKVFHSSLSSFEACGAI